MNILVVCHGNVCRSPAAEAVLKGWLTGHHSVRSSGFHGPGRPAARKVRNFMAARGHDLSSHRSRLTSNEELAWAQLVVYMDGNNLKNLKLADPQPPVLCLAAMIGTEKIADPAWMQESGQPFRKTMEGLVLASQELARRILSGEPLCTTCL